MSDELLLTDKEVIEAYIKQQLQHLKPERRQSVAEASLLTSGWLLYSTKKAQIAKVLKHYKYDDPEYDPQAEEFGWYLEHGWLPPLEVDKLKQRYKQKLRVKNPFEEKLSPNHPKEASFNRGCYFGFEKFREEMRNVDRRRY